MNEYERVTSAQLDRLVDGELNAAERRNVLLTLDQDADGWRRLALAFLEAQALRDSLRSDPASLPQLAPAPETPPAACRQLHPSWTAGLVCAGICLFCLGWMARPQPSPALRRTDPADKPVLAAHETSDPASLPLSNAAPIEHQTLRLEIPDREGKPQEVEVPVVEGGQVRLEDLIQGPSVLPDQVYDQLRRTGRQIYEQRLLYFITLEDGRRGVVPVRDVVVEAAGPGQFQ